VIVDVFCLVVAELARGDVSPTTRFRRPRCRGPRPDLPRVGHRGQRPPSIEAAASWMALRSPWRGWLWRSRRSIRDSPANEHREAETVDDVVHRPLVALPLALVITT
jgi:hypothetical protein